MKKILAIFLVLLSLLSLASCKDSTGAQQSGNDDGTTLVNSGDGSVTGDDSTENTTTVTADKLTGEWICDQIITPQGFYQGYYNAEITKTDIQMRTTYKFNEDGSYSTSISILNISEVRKEYRSLMVEGARIKAEKEGNYLTTDDVLYYEKYADDVIKDICKEKKGTYKIQGNKLVYGDSTTETFALNGSQLTIKGNSQENGEYKITLKRK